MKIKRGAVPPIPDIPETRTPEARARYRGREYKAFYRTERMKPIARKENKWSLA